MADFSLSSLLADPRLRVHSAAVVAALPDLLRLSEQRALHDRLRALGVAQLGQRQRLVNVLLRRQRAADRAGAAANEPCVLEAPQAVRSVLAGDAAARTSSTADAALSIAECGFCICTGGLDAA
eukprot:2110456-Prymnesium_polylepis.1